MHMNDDVITDLKQFIAVTVHQEISGLDEKVTSLDTKVSALDTKVSSLDAKVSSLEMRIAVIDKKFDDRIDEVLAAIGDAFDASTGAIEADIEDHGQRLTKLEAAKV